MKITITVLLLCCSLAMAWGNKLTLVEETARGARFKTSRLEVLIEDGAIVKCHGMKGRVIFADNDFGMVMATYGIGYRNDGDLKYCSPDDRSQVTITKVANRYLMTWHGLGTGEDFKKEWLLILDLGVDDNGALEIVAQGITDGEKIDRVQIPLMDVSSLCEVVIPVEGGRRICPNQLVFRDTYYGGHKMEAPVFALECGGYALGMWMADETVGEYSVKHLHCTTGQALSFELKADKASRGSFTAPCIKLDCFRGDWHQALTPYRDWYARQCGVELAARRGNTLWSEYVQAILPGGVNMEAVSGMLPSDTTLLMNEQTCLKLCADGIAMSPNMERRNVFQPLPVKMFLFGIRPCVSVMGVEDERRLFEIVSCADALGAVVLLDRKLETVGTGTMKSHLAERMMLFANKRLMPFFPKKDYGPAVRCCYQGTDGVYQFVDDGAVQKMVGPSGRVLYTRLHNATSCKGKLRLPGWPLQNDDEVWGLSSEGYYAMTSYGQSAKTALCVTEFQEDVKVACYLEQDSFAYLELSSGQPGAEVALHMELEPKFHALWINGEPRECENGVFTVTMPAKILAAVNEPPPPLLYHPLVGPECLLRQVNNAAIYSGTNRRLIQQPVEQIGKLKLYRVDGQNTQRIDFICKVPEKQSSGYLVMQNRGEKHGDGCLVTVSVQGEEVHRFDSAPLSEVAEAKQRGERVYDNQPHECLFALGRFAGKTVLISIAIDSKGNTDGDSFYMGFPLLMRDEPQRTILR